MYGLAEFRKDWLRLLLIAVLGSPIVLLIQQALGGENVLRLWVSYKPALALFAGLVAIGIFFVALAVRTLMHIRHKGWQRLLIVAAVATLLWPIIMGSSRSGLPLREIFVEVAAVGLYFATQLVLLSQLVVGTVLWVRNGFRASRARVGD